ncbi:hypothetical protein [Richelia sinica]|uniref:hypothetical protein n=1 Tax=Richelia sinica TaxID=1357545 RepID=UPI0016828F51|nr:hypothetical protein [Richelia sinica]MBD2667302.1 hypothetical protein [Richelia sinica FACHB-800]
MIEESNHNPNIYEVVCFDSRGERQWVEHYHLLAKPSKGDFLNLSQEKQLYEVITVLLNISKVSQPPEDITGTIYVRNSSVTGTLRSTQPYNIEFIYNPPADIPAGACQPRDFKLWHERYFMVPRCGDIVLHEMDWYRVKDVLLSASGVYEIQVTWNAPK